MDDDTRDYNTRDIVSIDINVSYPVNFHGETEAEPYFERLGHPMAAEKALRQTILTHWPTISWATWTVEEEWQDNKSHRLFRAIHHRFQKDAIKSQTTAPSSGVAKANGQSIACTSCLSPSIHLGRGLHGARAYPETFLNLLDRHGVQQQAFSKSELCERRAPQLHWQAVLPGETSVSCSTQKTSYTFCCCYNAYY